MGERLVILVAGVLLSTWAGATAPDPSPNCPRNEGLLLPGKPERAPIPYNPEVYKSISDSERLKTLPVISLGDGKSLTFKFGKGTAEVKFKSSGRSVDGDVFVDITQGKDGVELVLLESQLGDINDALNDNFPESQGLIPAKALREAGITPLTEQGMTVHDLLRLRLLAANGVKPGTLTHIDLVGITDRQTHREFLERFRAWRAANLTAKFTRDLADKLLAGTHSTRYATRLAEAVGCEVESVFFLPKEDSTEFKKFVQYLEAGDVTSLKGAFPDIRLNLRPASENPTLIR